MLRRVPASILATLALGAAGAHSALAQPSLTDRQRADAKRLIDAALADSSGYTRLATLTDGLAIG